MDTDETETVCEIRLVSHEKSKIMKIADKAVEMKYNFDYNTHSSVTRIAAVNAPETKVTVCDTRVM